MTPGNQQPFLKLLPRPSKEHRHKINVDSYSTITKGYIFQFCNKVIEKRLRLPAV